jgi:integrase
LAGGGLPSISHDEIQTFGDFAKDWWTDDCLYCRIRSRRGKPLARSTKALNRSNLDKYLLPNLGKYRLSAITVTMVEKFLDAGEEVWGTCGPTGKNRVLTTLRTILSDAERRVIISRNPIRGRVTDFEEKRKKPVLLSMDEIARLFDPKTIPIVWGCRTVYYLCARFLLSTGTRTGEAIGFQVEDFRIESDTLGAFVCHSWDRKELKDTKTHDQRLVPLSNGFAELLIASLPKSGFAFSETEGRSPISPYALPLEFGKALSRIGIPKEKQKARHLTLHKLRYCFNTDAQNLGIQPHLIRAVTGHSSAEMTEHYTAVAMKTLSSIPEIYKFLDGEREKNA